MVGYFIFVKGYYIEFFYTKSGACPLNYISMIEVQLAAINGNAELARVVYILVPTVPMAGRK